jgi:hypothetical protein
MGLKVAARCLLGLLLAATCWLAATAAPHRVPAPGAETTNWLAAHSLAFDGDELFVDADGARFRAAFSESPREVRTDPHSGRFEAPFLATRAWSAALSVAGERGPLLLNALALLLAALVGSWALRAPLGAAAPLWIALFLFGSVAFVAVFRWQSEILVFAAVVLAGALVWGRERPATAQIGAEQIYGGDLPGDRESGVALWPWPLATLLVGVAAIRHPAYALVAVPMLLDLPRSSRSARRKATLVLAGVALVLPVAVVAALQGAPWEAPAGFFHPALTGWNALYFAAGRNAGLLVAFLPVVVLALAPRRTGGRGYLPLAVGVAVLAQLVLAPFDWAGDLPEVGNPWFLPLFGALLFCAQPELRLRAAVLCAVAAAPFLSPYWLAPLSDGSGSSSAPAAIASFTTAVRGWLPFETSLRSLPGTAEIVRGGVRLRSTGRSLQPSAGKFVLTGASAPVLVESGGALATVRLDFSASAPAALTIEGGTAGNTTFRPSGEVAFEVTLGGPSRRHPLWWSRAPVSIYLLRVLNPAPGRMTAQTSAPAAEPVSFDLGLARLAGAEAGKP